MNLYRKKPVVIEAMRFSAYTQALSPWSFGTDNDGMPTRPPEPLWQWLTSNGCRFRVDQVDPGPAFLLINTLEGWMRADIGDFIIKGVAGEFYPCKPDIFEQTYEAVME